MDEWWSCRYDGTVSNQGRFCSWCGRPRATAERRSVQPANPLQVSIRLNGIRTVGWSIRELMYTLRRKRHKEEVG